jgi:hypothetical protein
LNQSFVATSATSATSATAATAAAAATSAASAAPGDVVPAAVDVSADGGAEPAPPNACQWCRAELPTRPNLNFCPFCGTDLKVVPCRSCGEELEPAWRFCPACGTEVSG